MASRVYMLLFKWDECLDCDNHPEGLYIWQGPCSSVNHSSSLSSPLGDLKESPFFCVHLWIFLSLFREFGRLHTIESMMQILRGTALL